MSVGTPVFSIERGRQLLKPASTAKDTGSKPSAFKRIIYLSGSMSGLPDFNREAFNREADRLRKLGHLVFNPAENIDLRIDRWGWREWLAYDIEKMLKGAFYSKTPECKKLLFNTLAQLPSWENSRGARIELAVAKELGMEIMPAEDINA